MAGMGFFEIIGKALLGAVVSYATSAITSKLFGKKNQSSSPTYSIGALQTQCNNNMVMPIIYGTVKCAGNSLWQNGSGSIVNRLVGFSIGKNAGVSDVRLDDVDINTLSGCSYTAYMGDGVQQIDSRVDKDAVTTYEYTDTVPAAVQTGETWSDGSNTWTAFYDASAKTVRGRRSTGTTTKALTTQEDKARVVGGLKYDAYLALTITASDKISSNPNLTAVWKGRVVKIYTSPTEYHEAWSNNVWCVLDFMTSEDGCGIPIEQIDIPSFIAAAAYAQPGDGSRDWQINLILDEKKSRQDWLNDMLLCFRAFRTYQNGKHGIVIDKAEPVSQIFTVKPTESIQIDWQEMSEDIERLIIKYPDPDYEWQNVGAPATMKPPFRNAIYDANKNLLSNGNPLSKTIEIHGITNFKQASQHAWFYLNQAQTCGEYITYTCNNRAINRTVGDVIGIFDPITQRTEPGLAYKRYRIMAMTEPQGMQIQMYCREYNETIYGDTMGSVAPVVSVRKINPGQSLDKVSDIVIKEACHVQKDGAVLSYIIGTCAFPPSAFFGSAVVEYSEDNGISWQYNSTITEGNFVVNSVKTGVAYLVRVRALNKNNGTASDWAISDAIIIVGKDTPPAAVSGFACANTNGGFTLSWAANSEPDLKGYKLFKGTGASLIADCELVTNDLIVATSYFIPVDAPGDYVFYIKAVDNSMNESTEVSTSGYIFL